MKSAIYTGHVHHRRVRPKAHKLRYQVFSLLIDLDEVPVLSQRLRLLRFDRSGVFSFRESDHGAGKGGDLRRWVDDRLAEAGMSIAGGRVALLTYPRMFGYVFNPLSVFFCYASSGALAAILYEVANTYGERHTYVIPVAGEAAMVRQSADKVFHVSPFLPDLGRYRFDILPPDNAVTIAINLADAEGPLLTATFRGERRPLTDRGLLLCLIRYPLMTLKIIAGIHWEALKLWRKGIRFNRHTPASQQIASTIVGRGRQQAR